MVVLPRSFLHYSYTFYIFQPLFFLAKLKQNSALNTAAYMPDRQKEAFIYDNIIGCNNRSSANSNSIGSGYFSWTNWLAISYPDYYRMVHGSQP